MRAITAMFVISMLLGNAASAENTKVPAKIYRVDGRPVPVSCLEVLIDSGDDARRTPIDLQTCGNTRLKPQAQGDGSIGYDIPDGGYFFYSYVGRSGGMDILSFQNSGGGTGHFTQLVGLRHSGHLISWAKDIAGGDRCNGGISGETISNGVLSYDQAITPYDLIELASPNAHLKAYHDLEDSAASCIGSVHRVGDEARWTSVNLTEQHWLDQKGWTDQYTYQPCFNDLYRAAVSRRHINLNQQAVISFSRAFAARCLSKH